MLHKETLSTGQKPDYEDSICRKWWDGKQWTIEYKWLDSKIDEITDEQKQRAIDYLDGKKSCLHTVNKANKRVDNE